MKHSPILTITQRDVREAFSDWRVLAPIFILAIFLPSILQYGLRIAIDFLDEPGLEQTLVPFGLMLAGFLPASFSLVGPLEAFVGERERNTLEALLSSPLTNLQLYLGKLIAAMLPPLLSSSIAMSLYTLFMLNSRRIYAEALTLEWIGLIVLLVLIKLLVMVLAALFLSVRSSSIRSANLLASLILLPMVLVIQVEALLFVNRNFVVVTLIEVGLFLLAMAFFFMGLRSFDREKVLAREHRIFRGDGNGLRTATSTRRYGPIWTIMRREVRETLTDWWILIPIIFLTILLPIMGGIGTLVAQASRTNPTDLQAIMPFFVLLVGFLPASFSLVIALEVFVGEKERGTLETLLSMPVSDRQIYVGKTLSSFVPPVLASLVSMIIYTSIVVIFGPPVLTEELTALRLLGMLALSWTQALAMVSGAVVISSHTSSVRVANLLASFVVLPVTVAMQLEAVFIIGDRYDILWWIGLGMIVIAVLLNRGGTQSLHRESILSREHLAFNFEAIRHAWAAFFREIRPAGVDPDKLAAKLSIKRFYTQELRVVWQELKLPLLATIIMITIAVGYGMIFNPVTSREQTFANLLVPTERIGTIAEVPSFTQIFARNARNMLVSGLMSTFSFGLIGLLVPLIAFFSVSYGATWAQQNQSPEGAWGFILGYALPHGIIELGAAMIMGALSLRIAASIVFVPSTYTIGRHILWATALYIKVWLFILVPLLLIASIIETTITPQVFHAIYGP